MARSILFSRPFCRNPQPAAVAAGLHISATRAGSPMSLDEGLHNDFPLSSDE